MSARINILRRSYLGATLSADAPTVEAIAAASGLAPSRWPEGDAPTLSGHEMLLRAACRVAGIPEGDVAVRCYACEAEQEREADPARLCVTHRRAPHVPEVLQHPWDVASRGVRAELLAAGTVTPRDLVRIAPEQAREALEGALSAAEAWARGESGPEALTAAVDAAARVLHGLGALDAAPTLRWATPMLGRGHTYSAAAAIAVLFAAVAAEGAATGQPELRTGHYARDAADEALIALGVAEPWRNLPTAETIAAAVDLAAEVSP